MAVVTLPDGRTLDQELVRQGLAWHYLKYAPSDRTLARLEAEAKAARVGLWSQPRPIPPWDWRDGRELPAGLAGKVVANRSSRLYHKATCSAAARIAERNRVAFDSSGDAEAASYRPARDCHKCG